MMRLGRVRQLAIFIVVSLVLVCSSLLVPLYMSASYSEIATLIWIFITHSGSTVGVSVLLLMCLTILAIKQNGIKNKLRIFGLGSLFFAITIGGIALANEHLIKENLKIHRPNILLLNKHYNFDNDTFYALKGKKNRSLYLKEFFEDNLIGYLRIDEKVLSPRVLRLWTTETGFSFPSGHSVSAFLLAILMSYIILLHSGNRNKVLIGVFFCWAVLVALSRVMLGVHSPVDISLGAIIGCLWGMVIILSGLVDRLFLKAA
ncbi:phosphatase PAP2 family protein [Labilibacter sediminis]|nr:phosphatase PAP2 family protein [Labilibacter sediminis]